MDAEARVTLGPRVPFDVVEHLWDWVCGEDGLVQRNWDMSGWPKGWAPLAASTARQKARLGYSPTADQTRTGKLESDARQAVLQNAYSSVRIYIPAGVNEYAAAHQFGVSHYSKAPHGKALKHKTRREMFGRPGAGIMPAREVFQSPTAAECKKEAEAIARGLLKEAGLGE
jgi:hypothetical protein